MIYSMIQSKKLYLIAEAFCNGYADGKREKPYDLTVADQIEKNYFGKSLRYANVPRYAREFYEDYYTISYYQARGLCLVQQPTIQWAYRYIERYFSKFHKKNKE